MQKINGDANALAVKVAAESGVDRFVYISSIQSTLPSFVLKGSVSASMKFDRFHHFIQMTFSVTHVTIDFLKFSHYDLLVTSRGREKRKKLFAVNLRKRESFCDQDSFMEHERYPYLIS